MSKSIFVSGVCQVCLEDKEVLKVMSKDNLHTFETFICKDCVGKLTLLWQTTERTEEIESEIISNLEDVYKDLDFSAHPHLEDEVKNLARMVATVL